MPLLTVIAGPNGAGKSTAIDQIKPLGEMVNVDDIARTLLPTPPSPNLQAARLALARIAELLETRQDFSFETTLSSHQALKVMQDARTRGYRVELAYIILRSPELHLARVKQRVDQGGHDIPNDVVLRRYTRSLGNLRAAVRWADQTIIYDNTEQELKTLIRRTRTRVELNALSEWRALDDYLARAIAAAL